MHVVSSIVSAEPAKVESHEAISETAAQQALCLAWVGEDSARPNLEVTSASTYPKLYTLPRMDHWWRAGRHTPTLTQ